MIKLICSTLTSICLTTSVLASNLEYENRISLPETILNGAGGQEGLKANFLSLAIKEGTPAKIPEKAKLESEELIKIANESLKQINDHQASPSQTKFFEGLEDLSGIPFITIDNDYSKDLDQAMYISKESDGSFIVYYAIADASWFLQEGSSLDTHASNTIFTTYLPGFDVPVLPRNLSEGICSLNPNELRRSIVAIMQTDSDGNLLKNKKFPAGYTFSHAMVKNIKQLSYRGVQEYYNILDNTGDHEWQSEIFHDTLDNLRDLGKALRMQALKRGVVNFPEGEFRIFPDNQTWSMGLYKRFEVEKYNEQISVLANHVVGKFISEAGMKSLHRHHPEPEDYIFRHLKSKLDFLKISSGWKPGMSLAPLVHSYHQKIESGDKQCKKYQAGLEVTCRTNLRAEYSFDQAGHEGLKLDDYDHFTAPMRRYTDVVVHRILLALMEGKTIPYQSDSYEDFVEVINKASAREKTIDRNVKNYVANLVLKSRLGQKLSGTVMYIHRKYMTVEINGMPFDISIQLESLKDAKSNCKKTIVSTKSGSKFRLGNTYQFKVVELDDEPDMYSLSPI